MAHGSIRGIGILTIFVFVLPGCKKDSLEEYAGLMDDLIEIHTDATEDLRDAEDGNEAAEILREYRRDLQKHLPAIQALALRKHELKEKNRLKAPEVILEKTHALATAYSDFKRTLLFRSPRFLLTLDYSKAYAELQSLSTDSLLKGFKLEE